MTFSACVIFYFLLTFSVFFTFYVYLIFLVTVYDSFVGIDFSVSCFFGDGVTYGFLAGFYSISVIF